MMIKEIDLNNYLFNEDPYDLKPEVRREIRNKLSKEMIEIYHGLNVYDKIEK